MPTTKYDYLKRYINFENLNKEEPHNWFDKVTRQEIEDAEMMIEFGFPDSLKEFWLEIGYGSIYKAINGLQYFASNHILHPSAIANILILGEDSDYMLPEAVEDLEEGDIPFFEIGDMSSFLYMKRFSDNPDAVYDFGGILIEEHFERFIYRLYHESPNYYMKNW